MPSTHSALSVCVATTIGIKEGWDSPLFALAIVIAFIIMADAAGVRRETGEQAKVLNKIILEFFEKRKIREKNLKELVGHTPFEVIVGAFYGNGDGLGIMCGNLIYNLIVWELPFSVITNQYLAFL